VSPLLKLSLPPEIQSHPFKLAHNLDNPSIAASTVPSTASALSATPTSSASSAPIPSAESSSSAPASAALTLLSACILPYLKTSSNTLTGNVPFQVSTHTHRNNELSYIFIFLPASECVCSTSTACTNCGAQYPTKLLIFMSKPTVKHREPVTLFAPSALTSHVAPSVLTASAIITSLATKATLALPASLALPSSLAAPAAFSASLLTSTRSPQKPTDFNLNRAVVLNIAVNPSFAKYL